MSDHGIFWDFLANACPRTTNLGPSRKANSLKVSLPVWIRTSQRLASLDNQSYTVLRQDLASLLENERSAKSQGIEQEKAQTYWKVGQRLDQVVPVQKGGTGYGRQILKQLSRDLDIRERRLYEMLQFYRALEILPTSALLGWSHYRALLKVPDPAARCGCGALTRLSCPRTKVSKCGNGWSRP